MLSRRFTTSEAPRQSSGWARHARGGALVVLMLALLTVGGTSAGAVALAYEPFAASRVDETVPGYPWSWPVGGARSVVAPFRAPAHEYGPGHRGLDIAADPRAEVHAAAAGIVAFRGTVVDRPLLTIDHGGGYVSTWEPLDSDLIPGEAVAAGAVIGTVASGGHSVPGTLHVGVRRNDQYINPLPLFGDVPRAVLLPCCE